MESLKSLWNKVKEKLKNVGVEISEEYHPDVIFLETMAHRVHEIEVKLGIVPADPVIDPTPAAVETAAAPGNAELKNTDYTAADHLLIDPALAETDPAAAPGHAELNNAATNPADPIIVNGQKMIWNGKNHVPAPTDESSKTE